MTIDEIHQKYRQGDTTAAALTQSYIDRIHRLNPKFKAVLKLEPTALEQAQKIDLAFSKGIWRGPLHGIPVLIKDNIETKSALPTTAGSLALVDNVRRKDATVVAKLRRAGAIILGKTNLSEWANFRDPKSSSGWSALGGQTGNAHDAARTPSGSSSGSAVAVALNLAPIALGTETDGSIISPAASNGIYGIKPSRGVVSRTGVIPLAESQDTVGPMAQSLSDALKVLDVISGRDPKDDVSIRKPKMPQSGRPVAVKGLRIGTMDLSGFCAPTRTLFERSLKQLKNAGGVIIPVQHSQKVLKQIEQMRQSEFFILLYELKRDLDRYLSKTPAKVTARSLAQLIEFNAAHPSQEMPYFQQDFFEQSQALDIQKLKPKYQKLRKDYRTQAKAAIEALYQTHQLDILITPSNVPPAKIDHVNGDTRGGSADTSLPAIAGSAHMTLPLGSLHGLPVGLSLIANIGYDAKAFRITQAIDAVLAQAD